MRLALDAQTDQARRLLERLAPQIGDGPRATRSSTAPQDTEAEIVVQRDRVDAAARRAGPRSTGHRGRRSPPARAGGRPRSQGRLDHRRRRLGLRHRLRRPRPRAVVGPQRQHPRPRHRGLLEHRRPGLQGDPARRGGQVRGRRQGDGQEGPRRHRPRRTATSTSRRSSMGANELQTTKALARGRRLAGPVARHRVQHLHRPRHRHVEVDDPPEGCRQERLLAAVPLPAERDRGRPAVQARLASAVDPGRATSSATETRFAMLERTHPERAAELAALAQADVDERWRYYEQLAGDRAHRSPRPSTGSRRSSPRSRATPGTATRARGRP